MGETISQRIVESLPFLDGIAEAIQPEVQKAVNAGGTTVRNVLDGTVMELPLHPALTDIPVGTWTATLVFDAFEIASGSKAARNAADATLALGVVSGFAAAVTGLSDWRNLTGGSRRMGAAHGLLNTVGLALSTASLLLRASGRRNAGRLAFLAGFSVSGAAAHLGGELSYNYGIRINPNAFEKAVPDEFAAVMPESELPAGAMHKVEVGGATVLLSRSHGAEICAISNVCSHLGGALDGGTREGDTIICPLHGSRFNLCTGEVVDGPAVFPQPRYEVRVREGNVEIRAARENIQRKIS